MHYKKSVIALLITAVSAAPAFALGPLDGEAALSWWANDFEADVEGSEVDAGALGGHAELWAGGWGLRGALFRSDLSDSGSDEDIDYLSLDFKRRLFSLTDSNFIAAGFGWENLRLEGEDSNGARLLLEGRVGFGRIFYFYGQTAWLPTLEDVSGREDLDAFEIEAGLGATPLPFVSLRAGYRRFSLDFTDPSGDDKNDTAQGVVFGAGLHF